MYTVLKSVIRAGDYKLEDIRYKVRKLYATGSLTEEQMDQLLEEANQGVSADAERPDTLAMLKTLSDRVDALEKEIAAMKEPATEPEAIEAWKPWDGLSDQYQYGAVVSHKGKLWISTYQGQNVWEPGTVDDRFWAEHTEEA